MFWLFCHRCSANGMFAFIPRRLSSPCTVGFILPRARMLITTCSACLKVPDKPMSRNSNLNHCLYKIAWPLFDRVLSGFRRGTSSRSVCSAIQWGQCLAQLLHPFPQLASESIPTLGLPRNPTSDLCPTFCDYQNTQHSTHRRHKL